MDGSDKPESLSKVRIVRVDRTEAGQKLVTFLERRLGEVPRTALMRLIRTGQVRVNSGRRKPFDRVNEGDEVRIPPCRVPESREREAVAGGLTVVHEDADILVVAKPAGLPVQPGTGHTDCVSARLKAMYPDAAYVPTPAHRLDRDTSGLLLVGKSYAGLSTLHEIIRDRRLGKTYLAWVAGDWPHSDEIKLRDLLAKAGPDGKEKVRADVEDGQEAVSLVRPLIRRSGATLLAIRLLTGRTHQIRVQLSSRGFPILGDRKYGGPNHPPGLMLHAFHLALPFGPSFTLLPDWPTPWAVTEHDATQIHP